MPTAETIVITDPDGVVVIREGGLTAANQASLDAALEALQDILDLLGDGVADGLDGIVGGTVS